MLRLTVLLLTIVALSACASPEADRLKETTRPTYDPNTGRLKELTYDGNANGRIDTWTDLDGTRVLDEGALLASGAPPRSIPTPQCTLPGGQQAETAAACGTPRRRAREQEQ